MNNLNKYIIEKLHLNKNLKGSLYMVVYQWNKKYSGYIVYDSFEDAISGIRNYDGYEKLNLKNKTFNSVFCINKEEDAKKVVDIIYSNDNHEENLKKINARNVTNEISDELLGLAKNNKN
jgi:hypothetical protein